MSEKCLIENCKYPVFLLSLCQKHHTYYTHDRLFLDQKNIRFLSLDLSKHSTGFAYFESKKLLSFGLLKSDKTKNDSELLESFRKWLKNTLMAFQPHVLVVEELNVGGGFGNLKVSTIIAEYHGIMKSVLYQYNATEPEYMNNKHWKSVIGVKGRAKEETKPDTMRIVNEEYTLTLGLEEDDLSDAIGIGMAWYKEKKDGK